MRPSSTPWTGAALVIAALITGVTTPARADWPPFGRGLGEAPGNQLSPAIVADGQGGAIVAWTDARAPLVRIFVQHVLASGEVDPGWPAGGRPLVADSLALVGEPEAPAFPVIISDGAGGAIVAWQEGRTSTSGADIFAQHVLASGALDPAWPANGVVVCALEGVQDIPEIAPDGAGGAIVTWMDGRTPTNSVDVYAQHLLASGTVDPAWPVNGVALSTAPGPQAFPNLATDGSGGAIVTWFDFRPAASGIDIYAQRVLAAGNVDPAWPANGRALCAATGSQFDPRIVSDGAHGAVVAWLDTRDGRSHVYAQRVLPTGQTAPGWPADGRAVIVTTSEQMEVEVVSDDAGGALVMWRDMREGVIQNLFGQHVRTDGTLDPAWPVNGTALSAPTRVPLSFVADRDGAGGAFVAFEQGSDVFAQHLMSSGALDSAYPDSGRALCTLPSQQANVAVIATGAGGAIATWTDTRNGADPDVFALQVLAAGTLDVPETAPAPASFARPTPNPARGAMTLRFTLPRAATVRLDIFDAAGRRIRELASGERAAGEHSLGWDLRDDRGRSVDSGVYFARLETGGQTFTTRMAALR